MARYLLRIVSNKGKGMVHGTGSLSQIQHSGQRAGDILFCSLHRFCKSKALGEIGSDGAGQCAACAVGVGIIDSFTLKPGKFIIAVQQIVGIVDTVTAFEQNGTMVVITDILILRNLS